MAYPSAFMLFALIAAPCVVAIGTQTVAPKGGNMFSQDLECVDGVCPMSVDSFMQHKAAADMLQMCPGPCGCDTYQSDAIVFGCSEKTGNASVDLKNQGIENITTIPLNVSGVSIDLNAIGDIDLRLYDKGVEKCVFGWGCTHATGNETVRYKDVDITFSGDDQGDTTGRPVKESITIVGKTTTEMLLDVKAYANTSGTITYWHGAISPCVAQKPVCSKCSNFKCAAGETPKCDGSTSVKCLAAPTGAPTTAPTTTPTALPTSPPTPPPTSAPTPTPTTAPTLIGPGCAEGAAFKYKVDTDLWLCALDNNKGGTWKSTYSSCNENAGFHLATVNCMTKRGAVRNNYDTASKWAGSKGFQYLVTGQPVTKRGGQWRDMMSAVGGKFGAPGCSSNGKCNDHCGAYDGILGYLSAHGNTGFNNWKPLFDNNFAYSMCAGGGAANALISVCQNAAKIGASVFDHRCY